MMMADCLVMVIFTYRHGGSSGGGFARIGKQHGSLQSSSQPQSHSSPSSTTSFPHIASCGSVFVKKKG